MSRPAATMLVAVALMGPVSAASAQTSHLTANPPMAQTETERTGSLPNTGTDTRLEVGIGAMLLASGAALRRRRQNR